MGNIIRIRMQTTPRARVNPVRITLRITTLDIIALDIMPPEAIILTTSNLNTDSLRTITRIQTQENPEIEYVMEPSMH